MRKLIWIAPLVVLALGCRLTTPVEDEPPPTPAEQLAGTWRLVHGFSEDVDGEWTRVGVTVETLTFTPERWINHVAHYRGGDTDSGGELVGEWTEQGAWSATDEAIIRIRATQEGEITVTKRHVLAGDNLFIQEWRDAEDDFAPTRAYRRFTDLPAPPIEGTWNQVFLNPANRITRSLILNADGTLDYRSAINAGDTASVYVLTATWTHDAANGYITMTNVSATLNGEPDESAEGAEALRIGYAPASIRGFLVMSLFRREEGWPVDERRAGDAYGAYYSKFERG